MRLRASLAMLLPLAGCGAPAPDNQAAPRPAATATPTPVAAQPVPDAVRSLPESEQTARAFAAAFGTPAPRVADADGAKATTKPARLLWQGDTAILITTTEIADGCHACTGSVGIHYLAAAGDGFTVTGRWPEAITGNGFGGLPDWSVSTAFADHPVIVAEAGYTAQGCTSGGATLTELAPGKPLTSALIRTIYENQSGFGDDNGASITGKIANIDRNKGFDVVYRGSRSFTEHWIRQGATFIKAGGETAMPQC